MNTITNYLNNAKKEENEQKVLNLIKMICIDDQPFAIVDNIGFKLFIKSLNPLFEFPCWTIIPKKIEQLKNKISLAIKDKILNIVYLTLTSDEWSSNSLDPYLLYLFTL